MKNLLMIFIIILSISLIIYGISKQKKSTKSIGYAVIIFIIIAIFSDFIGNLNF
ncbi:hypothetical protein K5V21_01905 [Clostridium sardiniense]|uniref:Exosortase n=1 Tax=Clostridium sardiniense TaxID=29369 RepID=A0ABS7KTP8_CLOSR|nr:hypothetical protein [Clostridium sardiniense]MBY0754200.1 hypothetical protein [Clostridium sardiniense]MDQ0461176.1 amino acid transporter [Clostridium sardiniense]